MTVKVAKEKTNGQTKKLFVKIYKIGAEDCGVVLDLDNISDAELRGAVTKWLTGYGHYIVRNEYRDIELIEVGEGMFEDFQVKDQNGRVLKQSLNFMKNE